MLEFSQNTLVGAPHTLVGTRVGTLVGTRVGTHTHASRHTYISTTFHTTRQQARQQARLQETPGLRFPLALEVDIGKLKSIITSSSHFENDL